MWHPALPKPMDLRSLRVSRPPHQVAHHLEHLTFIRKARVIGFTLDTDPGCSRSLSELRCAGGRISIRSHIPGASTRNRRAHETSKRIGVNDIARPEPKELRAGSELGTTKGLPVPELLQIVLLALLPAAGNFAGGLLAEAIKTTRANLSLALHVAAGIVLGVVAMELAPRAFGRLPAWLAGLAFLAGGGAYLILDSLVEKLTSRGKASDTSQNVRSSSTLGGSMDDLCSRFRGPF